MIWFQDLFRLVFPHVCPICGKEIASDKAWVCTKCMMGLPLTDFWQMPQNPVEQKFWGHLPVVGVCSLFTYTKGSRYVQLVHDFKYRKNWRLAYNMGHYFGTILQNSHPYATVDYVVPIPLHYRRRMARSYNQSEYIARGIAKELHCAVDTKNVRRKKYNPAQTHKSRIERWDNVADIFESSNIEHFRGKHILIVDDVLTTGSTIISCVQSILDVMPDCRISIVALAARVDMPGRGPIPDIPGHVKV